MEIQSILTKLGEGSFANVSVGAVEMKGICSLVALKILKSEKHADMFEQEYKVSI